MYSTYIFPKKQVSLQDYYNEVRFTEDEINKILEEVKSLPFQEGETIDNDENKSTNKNIRSSQIKWIPKTNNWRWLYQRLMECALIANEKWDFDLCLNE